jgi:alpha-amylase
MAPAPTDERSLARLAPLRSAARKAALIAGFAVGLVALGCGSADGPGTVADSSSSTLAGLRIHFHKPADWTAAGSPKMHYWGSKPSGIPDTTWPGVAMAAEGSGWYLATVPGASSANIVFDNNPSPQTRDLSRAGEGWYDGGTWYDSAPSAPTSTAAGLRIHFRKPAGWTAADSPKIHYWNLAPAGLQATTWPGLAMVAEGSGWYGYTIAGATSASLLFDNNPSPQTADLTRASEGWYDSGPGTWFDTNPDVKAPRVTATPLPGSFQTSVTVSLAVSPVVPIHYSINSATDPGATSPVWTGDQTFTDTTTLKTWVEQNGASATSVFVYTKSGAYQTRDNQTILQAFDWYIQDPSTEAAPYAQQPEPESNLWEYIAAEKAETIYNNYFTHVWLPPTGKAFSPDRTYNQGYAVYDHYDLGEFDQMGRVRTKYGTREQLLDAVKALHARKIKVVADIVMNHMLGSDNSAVMPYTVAYDTNKLQRTTNGTVTAYLDFDFANTADPAPRRTTYSAFHWTKDMFTGMESYGTYYLFAGRSIEAVNDFKDLTWPDPQYNSEYQYLRSDIILGADVDLTNPSVATEMVTWTKWLVDTVGFDGFRLDAVRHMGSPFLVSWSGQIRSYMASVGKGGSGMLMFGENWDGWNARLNAYLLGSPVGTNHEYDVSPNNYCGISQAMSLFDVPLHYDFQKVAGENADSLDISQLPASGLVALNPGFAVTFVDNHDTIPTQPLASYINVNTKLQAYTFILLNEKGTPTVFYRDLYKGNYTGPHTNDNADYLSGGISKLLEARAKYAYGPGTYYSSTSGLLGYKRSGDGYGHAGSTTSGLVYLIKQFDRNGNPTNGNTSLSIPDDGRSWILFAGGGTRSGSTFSLAQGAKYAVWVPAN